MQFTITATHAITTSHAQYLYICNSMGCCGSWINSTSTAEVIARGETKCNLLHYKCYQSRITQQPMLSRGVTRKSEQRGDVATGCTYSRSQSATISGNETQVASFSGFICLGASSRVRRLTTSLPTRTLIQLLTKTLV